MTEVYKLKEQLNNGDYNDCFAIDLCCDPISKVKRACSVLDRFLENFHNDKCDLFSSPGRTELGGNHTDHQKGHVLAAAVNADMLCAASVTDDKCVRIVSEGFGSIYVDLSVKESVEEERGTAAALVRGIAVWFEERGYSISGLDAYVTSDVPAGSGISSSASFEVLIGTIFNCFFADNSFSSLDIAKAGLFAENKYFGKPCGLMDQTACACGGIVSVDFTDPDEPVVRPLVYDFSEKGYSLCLVSTGSSHDDLTQEYSAITDEMKSVANLFEKMFLSELDCETVLSNANYIREQCGDRAFLRAVNYFAEDKRAQDMYTALNEDDIDKYFELVNASGRGSFMYLQNIFPAGSVRRQAVAVALQMAEISLEGAGAYRVHGGGFAGTIQAYVPNDRLESFVADMEKVLFPNCCKAFNIRRVGAVKITGGV